MGSCFAGTQPTTNPREWQAVTSAQLSLVALAAALALSMTSRINVGWVALAFAWLIGVYREGMRPETVMAGFPVTLFITLSGVALLFAIAETNGTLPALAASIVKRARGNARAIPVVFFVIACALSSVGPGAISTVALMAPLAMTMGDRLRVPALLTALMVTNGANAGNLSPFSAVGIIANGAMARAGMGGHELRVWFANFAAHVFVAAIVYAWFLRRLGRSAVDVADPGESTGPDGSTGNVQEPQPAWSSTRQLTLLVIGAWIGGILVFGWSLGFSAFAASALLILAGAAEEGAAVRRLPWGVIMMVCGVSVLIALLEKTGGMDLFTSLLARASSPATINGVIAFVTGAISTYSSTSGVVLPAFLPTVPSLVDRLGGGDPIAIALSINVGSSLVDVSPLSTLGALCVAAAPRPAEANGLFRGLLLWGLSMTIVGAAICQLLVGPVL